MAPECEPALFGVSHIPKLDRVIHGTRDEEVTGVVEITFPNWLTML